MYRIIVTCHYPDWPDGIKIWFESLVCVAGPFKKLAKVQKLLRRRGFEPGRCYPFTWTVHPHGDEAYYEAKVVCTESWDKVRTGSLPEHVCAGDDDLF